MGTILLIILILLLIGALPAWPYSSGWGYWPSGGLGLILLILIILALTGNRLWSNSEGLRSEASSALKQVNDQDDNSNPEQEMN